MKTSDLLNMALCDTAPDAIKKLKAVSRDIKFLNADVLPSLRACGILKGMTAKQVLNCATTNILNPDRVTFAPRYLSCVPLLSYTGTFFVLNVRAFLSWYETTEESKTQSDFIHAIKKEMKIND